MMAEAEGVYPARGVKGRRSVGGGAMGVAIVGRVVECGEVDNVSRRYEEMPEIQRESMTMMARPRGEASVCNQSVNRSSPKWSPAHTAGRAGGFRAEGREDGDGALWPSLGTHT